MIVQMIVQNHKVRMNSATPLQNIPESSTPAALSLPCQHSPVFYWNAWHGLPVRKKDTYATISKRISKRRSNCVCYRCKELRGISARSLEAELLEQTCKRQAKRSAHSLPRNKVIVNEICQYIPLPGQTDHNRTYTQEHDQSNFQDNILQFAPRRELASTNRMK